MRITRKSASWRLVAGAIALTTLMTACGGGDGDQTTRSGSIGEKYDLTDATFTVGSKEFTEQLILGNITKLALGAAGAEINDQIGLQGSTTVRQALLSGDIDMYWEYLGTGWVTHLQNETGIPGAQAQYVAVRDADAANKIVWLEPTPFDDTYAIAVSDENAQRLNVKTISDFAELVANDPAEATFCAGGEFSTRPDALPGLEQAYGFTLPQESISNVQDALVYTQVDKGDCNFGSIFATDGRIASLGLTVLTDDKMFFPPFNASLNVREDVLNDHPEIADIFAPISAALDNDTMVGLNAKVDVDGEDPAEVAQTWMRDNGYIG